MCACCAKTAAPKSASMARPAPYRRKSSVNGGACIAHRRRRAPAALVTRRCAGVPASAHREKCRVSWHLGGGGIEKSPYAHGARRSRINELFLLKRERRAYAAGRPMSGEIKGAQHRAPDGACLSVILAR